MNNKENMQNDFLQTMNEKLKSELLDILPEDHEAVKVIQSAPCGQITSEMMEWLHPASSQEASGTDFASQLSKTGCGEYLAYRPAPFQPLRLLSSPGPRSGKWRQRTATWQYRQPCSHVPADHREEWPDSTGYCRFRPPARLSR